MYQFEFSQSMSMEEQRDFVQSMEYTLRSSKYLTVITESHDSAIWLSNLLERGHEHNNIAAVHIYGSTLRAFAEPEGEHGLMMVVVIKSR